MENTKKIQAVTVKKIYEILGCHHTKFYQDYAPRLKEFTFYGTNKRVRLYPLDKVMEIKKELDEESSKYIIVN